MANIPQKSPDPTEETLTAIREALVTDQPERLAAPPVPPASDSDPACGSRATSDDSPT